MKTTKKLLLALAILAFGLQSCGNKAHSEDVSRSPSQTSETREMEYNEKISTEEYATDMVSIKSSSVMQKSEVRFTPPALAEDELENFIATKAASAENDGDKSFIRTANLSIKVKNVVSATQAIEDIVIARKGFIINSRINSERLYTREIQISKDSILSTTNYKPVGSLTLRVHYTLLDETLRAIAPIADQVAYREVDANDISFGLIAKYLEQNRKKDKTQRIKNVSATATGQKLNERLNAEDAIDRAREMADNAYLAELQQKDLVKYSTITINLEQEPISISSTKAIEKRVEGYEPGYAQQIGKSIAEGWYAVAEALIALLSLWPLWIVVGAGVFVFRTYRKRKKNKE